MNNDDVCRSYDSVAHRYAEEVSDELTAKPLDRALLRCFAELVREDGGRPVGDVGCGTGHVTAYLALLGVNALGVDVSPGMVEEAERRNPGMTFHVGSMLDLPVEDAAWAGAICLYSVIHLDPDGRRRTYSELARAIRAGGWLLVAFHISSDECPAGASLHVDEWWDIPVELDFRYLDPDEEIANLRAAGWVLRATVEREPLPGVEYASRRAYLLASKAV